MKKMIAGIGVVMMLTGLLILFIGSGAIGESAPMKAYYFIKKTHPAPFGVITEAEFEAEAKRLDAQWDALEGDGSAGYALMRLTASLGDEHTQAVFSRGDDYALPFLAMCVEGRLIIVQAHKTLSQLVGMELTAIGGMPIAKVYERVKPYLSGETDGWLGVRFAQAITSARLLEYVGVLEDPSRIGIAARNVLTGEEIAAEADTLRGGYDYSAAQMMALPQTLMQSGYYYAALLEQGEVFIQYNVCADNPQMPMADFAQAVLAQMGAMQPETVIVDLRHNTGGDSEVINPLLDVLERMMETGSTIYVLIGQETFSSGVMNAQDLRRIGAVLVGEPTGGVMGFGELKSITVGDGLTLYCSSKDFSGGVWPHEPVLPDVLVTQTAADFVQGIDSAIIWIRSR